MAKRNLMVALATFAVSALSFAAEKGMDLYLLIGQSNMAGRGILTEANRIDADRIFKLDAAGKWQKADEPIHFDKKIAGAGLAASFARTMADVDKDVTIGLIPCAVGGTRIDRWVEGGDLWSNAVKRTRLALKSGTLKGILWHQGEGDASPQRAPQWGARLESMIKSFRREFGDVPFVAGELGWYLEEFGAKRKTKTLWREINAQLHALEGKVGGYRVVSAEGLKPNRDILHFSTEALREFGRRFAVAFLEMKDADAFALQHAEFARYYREMTGKEAPEGIVKFAIDPKVSKSGRDAYSIVSTASVQQQGRTGSPLPAAVTITGSNVRSVWYGLYDLLERRGGCHWFWDGDVVPKKDLIDLSNLDIHEEARFEYRGLRYFAHRGLTRFQAEHWGPDDWKKEIDWILKRRLNVFMLRIGQDDLFQLAFPEACAYPDPSKPQPGAGKGYNDRSLFWSLQFRGKLRRDLQKYGFERGLMVPEDYGTMTHWYAPTPLDYIANRKPPFYPGADSRPENNRVWDVRDDRWIDEYWKMTKTAVETYGKGAPKPQLLHTIGTGERILSKDKKENFKLKVLGLQRFMSRVERDYPEAKLLMPGWDFYFSWTPQEVKDFLKLLDPKKCIVWDYSADQKTGRGARSNFTKWDVIGKFPYTYSIFLAYEKALDARADYPIIEERQKLVQNDPFCVGYIFWPESSHTDTLLLRYFTANAWSDKAIPHGEVLDEFCASRYGKDAEAMKAAWKAVLPASWLRDWTTTYGDRILAGDLGDKKASRAPERWRKPVAEAEKVFGMLAKIEWKGEFVRRDTIDIARMALDRIICLRRADLSFAVAKWRKGECKVESGKCKVEGGNLVARAEKIASLCDLMADLLALHTDYSLWESYRRLDAVEKIRNPDFSKTLFENASCGYCRSHQYEFARYWYAPHAHAVAENLAKAVASGDRGAVLSPNIEEERLALKERPLESLKPVLPRTEENFCKIMRRIMELQ